MRILKAILVIVSIVALLLVVLMLWGRLDPRGWAAQLWSERSASSSELVEMEYLAQLNTAEYRMELIFPYDFVQGTPDWGLYKNLWDLHPANFYSKIDPDSYSDGELPPQWVDGPLYAQCREIGVDPYYFRFDFLVLSVLVKAGVDLDSQAAISVEYFTEEGQEQVVLQMPQAEITELSFLDQSSSERGYPDAPISPRELRALVELLTPAIEKQALEAGILQEADEHAREIVEHLLLISTD